MANEPTQSDSENQSLRKINAGMSSLTADVADGIDVNGLSGISEKLPALVSGRIPVDIGGSGSISITSGTVTVSNEVEVKNTDNNPIPTTDRGSVGVTNAATFSSLSAQTLANANPNRKLLAVFNEGPGNLHLLYGSGAVTAVSGGNYSVKVAAGEYLEIEKYTGQIEAIFATSGTAKVTEIV